MVTTSARVPPCALLSEWPCSWPSEDGSNACSCSVLQAASIRATARDARAIHGRTLRSARSRVLPPKAIRSWLLASRAASPATHAQTRCSSPMSLHHGLLLRLHACRHAGLPASGRVAGPATGGSNGQRGRARAGRSRHTARCGTRPTTQIVTTAARECARLDPCTAALVAVEFPNGPHSPVDHETTTARTAAAARFELGQPSRVPSKGLPITATWSRQRWLTTPGTRAPLNLQRSPA